MSLLNLPPETLSLILEFLGIADLATLLLSQRVCRYFHAEIQRILFHNPSSNSQRDDENGVVRINPLLKQKFKYLFRTGRNRPEPSKGDLHIPFRYLPWAFKRAGGGIVTEGAMRGSPFLRPEATWRRLSITYGAGPPIRNLDVIHVGPGCHTVVMTYSKFDILTSSHVAKSEDRDTYESEGDVDESVDENMSGTADDDIGDDKGIEGQDILTMGLLYDLLASAKTTLGNWTSGWKLLPGRRLDSYDDWMQLRKRENTPSLSQIEELFVEDPQSAVLFVTARGGCMLRRNGPVWSEDRPWIPEAIGATPIVLVPWPKCEPGTRRRRQTGASAVD